MLVLARSLNLGFLLVVGLLLSGCGAPEGGDDDSSDLVPGPQHSGVALMSWTPPTQNTDGSPLTDLAGYKVYYGVSTSSLNTITVSNPGLSSYMISGLPPAKWYFAVAAFNSTGVHSPLSAMVSKTIN